MDAIRSTYRNQGSVIVEYALDEDDLARMGEAFARPPMAGARHDALPPDLLAWLGAHPVLGTLATALAAGDRAARLVRAVSFDKSPEANWFVPWHQDRTIAVRVKAATPGFEAWTRKDGVDHVEPPVAVLERMVTLRIHLDDCDEDNGPLEILRGSNRHGRLGQAAIGDLVERTPGTLCLALRGDILAMSPLTVHRSQRARRPRARRILHLDWAACELPTPLVFQLV
jgi:hypothetical protein